MSFLKQNLNKILVLMIYIIMFYLVPELYENITAGRISDNYKLLSIVLFNVSIYLILIISCCILLKKEIITDFKSLTKTNAMTTFFICLVGIVCVYIGNILGTIITFAFGGKDQSQNQAVLEIIMTSKYGILMGASVVIIGPIVEELIFRKSMHEVLRHVKCPTWLMLIISSVLFGLIHVIDSGDFVQVFPYIFMGLTMGGIEIFSKNIYSSIFVHIFMNAIATLMILYQHTILQFCLI